MTWQRSEGGEESMADDKAGEADHPEQHYAPEQTGMYELEFPAPQLSSADGRGRATPSGWRPSI
jgi:hypothetical protein